MDADNRGYEFGGVGLWLRPRDMLAFGRLYLRRGAVGGASIVSADCVGAATAPHVDLGGSPPEG